MKRFWTRTLTATLCMLILVLPAMASETPLRNSTTPAIGLASDPAATTTISAQELLTSWQPAPGYETPRMQMTNTGTEQLYAFQGHDLTAHDAGTAVGYILYAPTEADNPTFRADVAACTGATVDYFDARAGTPSVALLSTYDCVLTWANYAYADNVLFGDNLAAYVDGGGKVILGQWCLPTAFNYLSGAIMTAAYCPVTGSFYEGGSYNGDGTDCVHGGVASYEASSYFDVATPVAGAYSDGTFNNPSNSLAVAWRADRMVYYSPGNTGGTYSTGDWAQLVCNMCDCPAGPTGTIAVDLGASPDMGAAPFYTIFTAQLSNLTTESRRAAAEIDVVTASGYIFNNWRQGWVNLSSMASFNTSWGVVIPAQPFVLGTNTFTIEGEDVTPAPFNQPPYAPSGDTDTDVQTVTAY